MSRHTIYKKLKLEQSRRSGPEIGKGTCFRGGHESWGRQASKTDKQKKKA